MLHGCEIADDCLIGIGSTILNKTKIGKIALLVLMLWLQKTKLYLKDL